MCYSPYPVCIGRKYRKTPQLNRPLVVIFNSYLCNNRLLIDKYKIRFLQHVIRLFYKDSAGFRVSSFFKNGNKCMIENNDIIHLVCHGTKAVLKKLLSKIGYNIDDYKLLKRRKYALNFTFFFSDCHILPVQKNVTLDIVCNENEMFTFFMVTNLYFAKDFIQLLFFYYIEEQCQLLNVIENKP